VSKHFTLKQFRYFLAVCDSGSIAAAARLVNIAQSALTKSIQELETTLGTPLFERLPRGMELTQSGYRFEAKARQVISAVMQAGAQRFRAIMLTSLTTFFGLVPIIAETSMQAQFLIPMATSLAFGIVFSTTITLFLIPSLYMILEDIKGKSAEIDAQLAADPLPV
jgi:DNA-binding transcriptional LysR family regulator